MKSTLELEELEENSFFSCVKKVMTVMESSWNCHGILVCLRIHVDLTDTDTSLGRRLTVVEALVGLWVWLWRALEAAASEGDALAS